MNVVEDKTRLQKTLCFARRYWWQIVTTFLLIMLVVFVTLWASNRQLGRRQTFTTAIDATTEFQKVIADCQTAGPNPPPETGHPCYDRTVKNQAAVIDDLRKSIDCTGIWIVAQVDGRKIPEACEEVVGRINELIEPGRSNG